MHDRTGDLDQITYCGLYCPFCADYPCSKVEALGERYPNLLADGKRLATIVIAAWIAEQEERARAGFCYADIRCKLSASSGE